MLSFKTLYVITQIFGLSLVIATVLWVLKYMGLVWDVTNIDIYNWHAICMVLGMVFCYGNSILLFRAYKNVSKLRVKIAHAAFHATSLVFISLGLSVEFISHYYHGEADLYSLHSWIGLATIVIFVCQFIFGLVCFLFPTMNEKIRASYLPVHVFFGILCFIMAIGTSLIGLNQNARFNMKNYEQLPSQGILINFIGVLMLIYGSLVVFLSTKPNFKQHEANKSEHNRSA